MDSIKRTLRLDRNNTLTQKNNHSVEEDDRQKYEREQCENAFVRGAVQGVATGLLVSVAAIAGLNRVSPAFRKVYMAPKVFLGTLPPYLGFGFFSDRAQTQTLLGFLEERKASKESDSQFTIGSETKYFATER
eukprot:TRINITY_DN4908_c0_g1_i3.p1 TRINITY_DN4908_c0_g1~~TRINITY_DN4908_c0_g1_i3.p1  ORF type:complete len:133 (-),score=17.92 TRINITY_DN4908_c0_g1_i3:96-494(-)